MSKNYIPHIDGLRGIAVLSVILYHLAPAVLPGGFVGVDIFFVISGFLITQIITNDLRDHTFSFTTFYAHRIRRIFPALFVLLLGTAFAAVLFLGPTPYYDFFKAFRYASFQGSNFLFAREVDYFKLNADPSPLLHTWSLGVESQFYLIWPILLMLAHRWVPQKWTPIFLAVVTFISLGTSEYLVQTNTRLAFYMLPSRAWELSIGGLAAILPKLSLRSSLSMLEAWIGAGLMILAIFISRETHFPGLHAVPVCLGTALVLYAGHTRPGFVHRLLAIAPLNFVGRISYSLYLWHWPVIIFYKSYFGAPIAPATMIGLGAVSFALAILSYAYVERPTRRIQGSGRSMVIAGVLGMIVLVLFSNIAKRAEKSPWRMVNNLDEQTVTANPYYYLCAKEGGAYDTKSCIIGPHPDRYEVILTGDSHAAHFIPTVLGWAKSRDLTTRIFLRGNCRTFVEEEQPVIHQGKVDTYCTQLTTDFYKTLSQDRPHIQYIFTSLFLPRADRPLERAFSKLSGFHKKIYYLGDGAIFDHHPIECEIQNSLLISKIFPKPHVDCFAWNKTYMDHRFAQSTETLIPLLRKTGISYIDFRKDMKTPFDAQGHFLFMDDNHMNNYGGIFLVPALIRHLKNERPNLSPDLEAYKNR